MNRRPSPPHRSALHLVSARWFVEGAGRVFNVALSIVGARWLGPAAWGVYWTAFSFAQVVTLATDLGGHQNLARRTAGAPARGPEFLAPALRLKHLLTLCVIAGWALLGTRLSGLPPALTWLLLLALLCLSYAEFLGFYLRGLGRIIGEAAILGGDSVLACAFGLSALALGAGLSGFAASQLVAHAAALAAAWAWVRASAPRPGRHRPGALTAHLAGSAPLAIAVLALTGSWRLGMLSLHGFGLAGTPGAGYYAVAHRLLDAIRFFPMIAAVALFPSFARGPGSRNPWKPLAGLLPASILASWVATRAPVAGWITGTLLGTAYVPAQPLLSLLLWSIPLMTVSAMLTNWLVVRGHTVTAAAVALAHLVTHAAGLVLLVPRQGPAGAATALVAAEAVATVATFLGWWRFRRLK
ncbi:MAG: oligosaccharide flippase family protein [Candidatus Coatesbacteria bacterium]